MRDYSITPATRKITIHTLDLVDRGKWINPEISHPYFTLNFTSDNPVFTGMGWSGIASITINLAGLRAAGEDIDNPHNPKSYMYDLDNIYKNTLTEKTETPAQADSTETEFEIEDSLAWFDDNFKSSMVMQKMRTFPKVAKTISDDNTARYTVRGNTIYRFRCMDGFVQVEDFGFLSLAPKDVQNLFK